MTKTVTCPTCRRPVTWEPASTWRPFCSERCRLIDLGDWFDENHRIPEPLGELPDGESDVWSDPSDDSSGGDWLRH
ncbi:MAG: DNA gyrase inhibitor YacG [Thiohalocapsa sp.]